jgi:hypothetical protein
MRDIYKWVKIQKYNRKERKRPTIDIHLYSYQEVNTTAAAFKEYLAAYPQNFINKEEDDIAYRCYVLFFI